MPKHIIQGDIERQMAIKILCIVGTRPNFVKAAPLMRQLRKHQDVFTTKLVHTGQHYDQSLSQQFFDDLGMAAPDISLGVGSGSHAQQTAKIMMGMEETIINEKANLVIVFGDVNSTLAASVAASKLNVKVAHVEAGLRSFDRTMPEEINRIVTDHLSDFLFVTEKSGLLNLRNEGISKEKVFLAGNIMIDSLIATMGVVSRSNALAHLGLKPREYGLMTLHRPSNVDDPALLAELLDTAESIGQKLPIVFPCHPRTRKNLEEFGLSRFLNSRFVRLIDPLGYIDFCRLLYECRLVLTDSGGVQEETTYLKIPCITMRNNTERPITVTVGSNVMTGPHPEKIRLAVKDIFENRAKVGNIPDLWDGHTAERVTEILIKMKESI